MLNPRHRRTRQGLLEGGGRGGDRESERESTVRRRRFLARRTTHRPVRTPWPQRRRRAPHGRQMAVYVRPVTRRASRRFARRPRNERGATHGPASAPDRPGRRSDVPRARARRPVVGFERARTRHRGRGTAPRSRDRRVINAVARRPFRSCLKLMSKENLQALVTLGFLQSQNCYLNFWRGKGRPLDGLAYFADLSGVSDLPHDPNAPSVPRQGYVSSTADRVQRHDYLLPFQTTF